jgi:hypothetical protein
MAKKISHADAGYTEGQPHCGTCEHFSEDEKSETGHCALVADPIDEDMWCRLYKPKRKPTLAEGYDES